MLIYRKAVRLANERHRKDGHRYFVMPNRDTKIFLIVTDRKNFRGIRKKGYIDRSMKMEDVFKRCFYYTPQANGEGRNITEEELKIKQLAYQVWYEKRIKMIPEEKKRRRISIVSRIKAYFRFRRRINEKWDKLEKKESEEYERTRRRYSK